MNVPRDAELRELEILRGLDQGARTLADLKRHSSYENVSSIRRLCTFLVERHQVRTWMVRTPKNKNRPSHWGSRPLTCQFEITDEGRARLAQLEQSYAARTRNVAS